MTEAFNKEFSLTSRPRLIALPPKLTNGYTQSSSLLLNSFKNKSEKSKFDLNTVHAAESRSHSPKSPTLSIKSVDV